LVQEAETALVCAGTTAETWTRYQSTLNSGSMMGGEERKRGSTADKQVTPSDGA